MWLRSKVVPALSRFKNHMGLVSFESPNGTCLKYALTGFAFREKLTLSLKILHSTCSCGGRSYNCKPFMALFFITHLLSLFKNLFCPLFLCQLMFHAFKLRYQNKNRLILIQANTDEDACAHTHLYTHTHMWCATLVVASVRCSDWDPWISLAQTRWVTVTLVSKYSSAAYIWLKSISRRISAVIQPQPQINAHIKVSTLMHKVNLGQTEAITSMKVIKSSEWCQTHAFEFESSILLFFLNCVSQIKQSKVSTSVRKIYTVVK